ncbi:FecR domain-containing protein [Sphingobium sp. AN558]|uniref:FecR family protein n=1 Tax=Sphingobium sp. AN558 TaxID=3133442 RepID=UPI0030BB7045
MVTPHLRQEQQIRAEAAAWLSRLQGQQTPELTKKAFRAWFDEDEAHRNAFGTATEIWDILPGAVLFEIPQEPGERPPQQRRVMLFALAAAILAMIGIGYAWLTPQPTIYATALGRQETILLSDGSRVDLNSDSQITMLYGSQERRLRLDRGEAMFHVRKDPHRPFIVVSGDERVRALGTTFVVRRLPRGSVVTLTHGRVEIARAQGMRQVALAVLSPGERATISPRAGVFVDRPQIDIVTAWRNGEVIFEDASLMEAAGEMNRYAGSKSLVVDASVATLRISGIFGIDELEQFAIAAATLHQLRIERQGGEIRLAPSARQPLAHDMPERHAG